ncbi:2-amino-4-hydroxy-6-hydroxymethyldihydropteridine diphosphokinase [Salinivibrio sp. ES.052]|uniref:2-amino-4-hydroxy-6- hydroxymethyldihydropteridine diphosphokinase n=1 Tax=Salinivibrio sp. ES.052 TaxID=1882823 RepID=UPI00092B4BE4|nr:2-amino-4-hydroxy-6-hydroxymethyldihydropteridine diphosphokinase [Salinivibrio sp. ES.052]SIO41389.1 2-amino-4-hydroxy-6-hydroxymethyldihydropteridinediphosphokinase [Salinivibrio sp. ES.052]
MTQALLSIGSNIERDDHIKAAVQALRQLDPGCRFSRIFEAEPVGFEGANFYNLIAEIHTPLALHDFWQTIRDIESRHGRQRNDAKCQDRTIDIDLLTFGTHCQPKGPMLPRNDIYKFAFTLWPLAELCPDQAIPGDGRTFSQLWQAFDQDQPLWPIETPTYLKDI